MFYVVPKTGLRVKDPDTMLPISPEGKQVPESVYWTRRIAAGDVELRAETPAATVQVKRSVSPKTKDEEKKA
jgi:hypothetical protein